MASKSNSTPASTSTSTPHNHAPSTPSGLRQSYTASPESSPELLRPGPSRANSDSASSLLQPPSETTALLGEVLYREHAHDGPCDHGTFSPRPMSPTASVGPTNNQSQSISRAPSPGASSESSLPLLDSVVAYVSAKGASDWRRRWAKRMKSKTMHRSSELAERHGVQDSAFMYVHIITCLTAVALPGGPHRRLWKR